MFIAVRSPRRCGAIESVSGDVELKRYIEVCASRREARERLAAIAHLAPASVALHLARKLKLALAPLRMTNDVAADLAWGSADISHSIAGIDETGIRSGKKCAVSAGSALRRSGQRRLPSLVREREVVDRLNSGVGRLCTIDGRTFLSANGVASLQSVMIR